MLPFNPFDMLGSTAAKVGADVWTAAWLSVWNGGLWVLQFVLGLLDDWLTPDLGEAGPGRSLYEVTWWMAGVLVVVVGMWQIGVALLQRDGRVLGRLAVGLGQFMMAWVLWIGWCAAVVAGVGGITRGVMKTLLGVDSWSAFQPWQPFEVKDVADGGVAVVLGLMGLLMWIAAIGHLVVILARDAALLILTAITPVAAAGLVGEGTRAWFWKSVRWFHAAALTPLLVVIVTGIGIQFAGGTAAGHTSSIQTSIGSAVPSIIVIAISVVAPLALFKMLAFVDPGTSSGASMRAGMSAAGGLQGLLRGGASSGNGSASQASSSGQSLGESGAEAATTTRFATAAQGVAGALGPVGAGIAAGLGVMARLGSFGAALGIDVTNQAGIGHPTYQPDYLGGPVDLSYRNNWSQPTSPDTDRGSSGSPSEPPPPERPMPTAEPSGAAAKVAPEAAEAAAEAGPAAAAL